MAFVDDETGEAPVYLPQAQFLYSMYVPHDRVRKPVGTVSLTRQEFAAECDVNVLMARYDKAGVWPNALPTAEPKYLDLSDVPDFQSAMQLMIDANEAFMRLPATVRRDFDNDPAQFVAFAEESENLPKLREWGLAAPEASPEAPMRVEVVNPPEAPAGASVKP